VRRLLVLRREGRLTTAQVRSAADVLGVRERVVWRWLVAAERDESAAWAPGERARYYGRFTVTLAKKVPKRAWQKLSAGAGAKGHRFYDWTVIDLADPRPGSRQLLIRRNRSTGELAYYRCYSPAPVPLTMLVRVAGSRWRVEEFFQSGKCLAGLDEHQVRCYTSWSRWVTLAMLAHAFLAVVRAAEHAHHPGPGELIPLTCNEIQRLFTTLVVRPVHHAAHRLGWSNWRRRHQPRSQAGHYRRQAAQA
jgi:hypothetical protein